MSKPVKAIVLAAGRGTRLRTAGSDIPKVMRLAGGRPLLYHVLHALSFLPPEDIVIVVGYKKEQVMSVFPGYAFAEQKEQLGTGHAVLSAGERLAGYPGDLLICCGDMPLLRRETFEALLEEHRSSGSVCTILSGTSDEPLPYGRVIRDGQGGFAAIVEEKDCTPEQRAVRELNSGVYLFDAEALFAVLGGLGRSNAQGEYYLTDAPGLLRKKGLPVGICRRPLGAEMIGVNTPEQLHEVERLLEADA
jgi:UDP-N-acetylglucosamine diphosphorylase/glucosamine-1-phosphate N-acetyltransferase